MRLRCKNIGVGRSKLWYIMRVHPPSNMSQIVIAYLILLRMLAHMTDEIRDAMGTVRMQDGNVRMEIWHYMDEGTFRRVIPGFP